MGKFANKPIRRANSVVMLCWIELTKKKQEAEWSRAEVSCGCTETNVETIASKRGLLVVVVVTVIFFFFFFFFFVFLAMGGGFI